MTDHMEPTINGSPPPNGAARQDIQIIPPPPQTPPPPLREIRVVVDDVPIFDTARFEHMQRVATMMARGSLMPDSLRCKMKDGAVIEHYTPEVVLANCFMIVNQALGWKMDPFAVAQCVSVVHGKLCYEGKLVAAVIEANLGVRLRYDFVNDGPDRKFDDQKLGVVVRGTIAGENFERTIRGTVAQWHRGGKSPWASPADWERQLRYRGAREWARAHAPAVMLGVVADDEAEDFRAERRMAAAKPISIVADDIPESPTNKPPPVVASLGGDTQGQPDTIADPEGFLAKLREDIGFCSTEAEANEVREANAGILERLTPERRKIAETILSGEDQ